MSTPYNPLTDSDTDVAAQLAQKYNKLQLPTNDDEDDDQQSNWKKVGSFLGQHLLGGFENLAGRGGQRQSAADLLFKRQEAAQKQADWEQTYQMKQQQMGQNSQESTQRLAESKARQQDLEDQRKFTQGRQAQEDFNTGRSVPAPIPSLFTGAETDTSGRTKYVNSPGEIEPDTEGRPAVTAGGVTMIPRSLEETQDLKLQEQTKTDKAQTDAFHAKLADFTSDPKNTEWVKEHGDDLRRMQMHQLFGWTPPEETISNVEAGLLKKAASGDKNAQDALHILHPPNITSQLMNDPTAGMTQAAIDKAARMYNQTGILPPGMGNLSGAMRKVVMNRAGEIEPDANPMANKAFYDANKHSMASSLKAYDTITSFERVARDNMNLAMDKLKPVVDSGSPWINKPLRLLDEKALGNADLPAFRAAQQVASNEYARITALAGQPGVLSDHARNEIMSVNPSDITAKQMLGVLSTYREDAKNRQKETAEQLSRIGNRFGGVNQVRNILQEDPDVMQEFPELGEETNLSKPVTPKSTTGPGAIPLPPPPPPPGMQTHLQMKGKDGKTYDRIYHTKDDAALIKKAKEAGAVEVK
jgi:hypothetical protein